MLKPHEIVLSKTDLGAVRRMRARIGLLVQPEPMRWSCQTNENSRRIAGAALIYALNSWRHSVRAAVRLILK